MTQFLAYDKEKKEWLAPDEVAIDGNGKAYYITGSASFTDHYLSEPEKINHIALYPYIHRKDSDGNKVYEGSIVRDHHGEKYIVRYLEHEMRYKLWNIKREFYPTIGDSILGYSMVIGHIAKEDVSGWD